MSSIQDIRALEQRIFDVVQDYVDNNYNEDIVLAIGLRFGKVTLKAGARENIKIDKTTKLYKLKDLVWFGDDGKPEPDGDMITAIAKKWIFLYI